MDLKRHKRIIISGGGTGGHVFPAIAIADALRAAEPGIEILFVGAEGRMEMEKVPLSGYKIVGLPVAGFDRKNLFRNLKVIASLVKSLRMAKKILNEFKPDVAVGVGGFASGPLLKQACRMGIPALIQEQNSYAGITNKLLSARASVICVAYDGMEKYFPAEKIIKTGNPVRNNFENLPQIRREALEYFGIGGSSQVVLILGGSLGAGSINKCFLDNIEKMGNSGYKWIWQTGRHYYDNVSGQVHQPEEKGIILRAFIDRMDYAYSAADVVVTRSGAGTISELCLAAKPSILVPSPNVAEDHQTKNAMALARRNAALVLSDKDAEERLLPEILNLLADRDRQKILSDNISKMAEPHADIKIANEVLKLAGR
jgi:UDP-N-acetylglucosamine--N-acetylmuramyl-(pentapeptide) pyrophosphoryl-undecaprenol N-acetylglucosamine transferase